MSKKILIVEDDHLVAADISEAVRQFGYEVSAAVDTAAKAIQALAEQRPELVLMDIRLDTGGDGITAAQVARDQYNVPVVFVTAFSDEETVKRARLTQPYGYIVKPFEMRELRSAIEIALHNHAAEQRLRESETNFRLLCENANDGIVVVSPTGKCFYANQRMATISGYSVEQFENLSIAELFELSPQALVCPVFGSGEAAGGAVWPGSQETKLLRRNRSVLPVEMTIAATQWQSQPACLCVVRDVSERKLAETQVREKNEALERKQIALQEVLSHLESEKAAFKDNVGANVERLVLPALQKLRSCLLPEQEPLIELLERNVTNLCDSFGVEVHRYGPNLSQREIQVCNMIRNGLSSKEIAQTLRISFGTVEIHRNNIRRKLKLVKKEVNLAAFLRSL